MTRWEKIKENMAGALIVNILSVVLIGLFGSVAASIPEKSDFWMTVMQGTLIVIAIASIIAAFFQIYLDLIADFICKLVVFNLWFLYMMITAWRCAGESPLFGAILLLLWGLCIYLGIRYRTFVQEESFHPKTKIGKVIVSIGVLSSGAGGLGYGIGRADNEFWFAVIFFPIISCLLSLFFNSGLKQIEDQVEEAKQEAQQ